MRRLFTWSIVALLNCFLQIPAGAQKPVDASLQQEAIHVRSDSRWAIVSDEPPVVIDLFKKFIGFLKRPEREQEPVDASLEKTVPAEIPATHTKLRVAIHAGGAIYPTRGLSSSPNVRDLLKKLKWGYSYGVEATYFLNENIGGGVRFSQMRTSDGMDILTTDKTTGARRYAYLEENISVTFIGPVLAIRLTGDNKLNAFVLNAGVGYLGYRDKGNITDPIKINGKTVGYVVDIGYDIAISKQVSLGATLSAVMGALKEATYTENGVERTIGLDDDNRERLGHFTLSLGLRINLW